MTGFGKRLVFVAMAAPGGVAGHHYSMRDLARAFMREGWHVDVILFSNFGKGSSFSLAEFDPQFIKTGIGFSSAIRELRSWAREKGGDFFVAFDETSNRIANCALFSQLETLLPVKPGWLSSSSWSAASSEFVVFTAEDLIYYRNHRKYKNVNINLITARVDPPKIDQAAVSEIRRTYLTKHDAQALVLFPVRIERGKLYLFDAVLESFATYLQSSQESFALLIIGTEQESEFRQELEAKTINLPVSFCSDEEYIYNISSILSAGDIVYAAGRTAMEALLLDKRVFCPSGRKDRPVWEITTENFFAALSGNFTGRNAGRNLYKQLTDAQQPRLLHIDDPDLKLLVQANTLADAAVPYYTAIFGRLQTQSPSFGRRVQVFINSRLRLFGLWLKSRLSLNLGRLAASVGRG